MLLNGVLDPVISNMIYERAAVTAGPGASGGELATAFDAELRRYLHLFFSHPTGQPPSLQRHDIPMDNSGLVAQVTMEQDGRIKVVIS